MKRLVKKMIAVISTVVMVLSLAACGSSTASTGSTGEAKKKLVLGTSADYPPFEFIVLNDKGEQEYTGIDISLAKQLAQDKGMELEIVNMSFDNLMTALQKGEVDMVVSAVEMSEERKNVADFSDTYYTDYPPKVLVRKDQATTYTSVDSLKGKTVGAQMGTTKADIVKEEMPDSTLLALSTVTDLVNNLQYNKCDAIVVDAAVAEQYAQENSDFVIADISLGETASYYVAVKKGDPSKLQESFNATISKSLQDGTMNQWIEKADADSDKAVE